MKKFLLIAATLLTACPVLFSQEITDAQKAAEEAAKAISEAPKTEEKVKKPRYWTNSLLTKIDFGQSSFTNWAAGGYNNYTLKSFIDANANYRKKELFFNNRLQLDYGFLYSADKPVIQKSDDRIYYEGNFGYKATNKLNYSARFSFRSQFSNSYNYPVPSKPADITDDDWDPGKKEWKDARIKKSGLMSPAYVTVGLGIDWVPTKWLTVNVAPLTGGATVTTDEDLRKSYGMVRRKDYKDTEAYPDELGEYYRSARFQFGAQVTVDVKLKVNNNFSYTSQLVLFSDYLDNPQNVRVNWDNRLDWKIAKYFSLTLTTNLIYDDKVMVRTEKILDKYPEGRQIVQFKESLAFGFAYTIVSKNR